MNIIRNILGRKKNWKNDWDMDGVPNWKDCQPRNPMRQDEDEPIFFGPRRRAKEDEHWFPFKTSEGEQAFALKKKRISLKEAIEIAKSPWLTDQEIKQQIIERNGSISLAEQAIKIAKGAYKSQGYYTPRFRGRR